jgi:integrase
MEPRAGFEPLTKVQDIPLELELVAKYLRLKKNLCRKVVYGHCSKIGRFLHSFQGIVSTQTVEKYLEGVKENWQIKTYANYLCSFRRYIRDFKGLDSVNEYEFPDIKEEPIVVPSKRDLWEFFDALPNAKHDKSNQRKETPKYKALFLFLASSGLRLGEVLSLRKRDITP